MRTIEMPIPALLLALFVTGASHAKLASQEGPAPEARGANQSNEVITGDYTVERGVTVDHDLLIIGGDLQIWGEVNGDAVVIGGDLVVESSGVVQGDAFVTGGELTNNSGQIQGEMRTMDGSGLDIAEEIRQAVAGEGVAPNPDGPVASADRADRRAAMAMGMNQRRGPFRGGDHDSDRHGFGGIISALALTVLLAGIGTALVFYARPYLETVSDTVRGATLRSAGTGLAATFLAVPAFVVLIVALAVSIVGIPFLLVAIPVYPLAIFGGHVMGLLAVAHSFGERTAEQTGQPLEYRYRNSYAYLFTGVGMMVAPFFAANLIRMTGFLGFIGTLLMVVSCFALWVCSMVGFGAVILSRGGTRRTFVPPAPDTNFDSDDLFGDDPIGSASHV